MEAIESCIAGLIGTCCMVGQERYINYDNLIMDLRRKLSEFEDDFGGIFIREYNFNEINWHEASDWINFYSGWPQEFSSILLVVKPGFAKTNWQLTREKARIEYKIGLILETYICR